jgi:hypothetical protein
MTKFEHLRTNTSSQQEHPNGRYHCKDKNCIKIPFVPYGGRIPVVGRTLRAVTVVGTMRVVKVVAESN